MPMLHSLCRTRDVSLGHKLMADQIDEIPDAELDSILDWYDQALANGQGFKSEEEREAYFAELGDPLKHPLWAESMEDLKGNPMVDAFRQLREEDKTRVELVLMYKDEGNEFMRKKTVKERHEAIKRYSHALTLLDAADEARKEGNEDEADKSVNLFHLRSQTFNNRAMALMFLKNYGLALKDLTKALLYDPENVKAHYRKSKVLFQLKRPEFALKACDAGLASLARVMSSSSSPSDKDKDSERELLVLKEQCINEIERLRRLREAAAEAQRAKEVLWSQAWHIATTTTRSGSGGSVKMGPAPQNWRAPPQLVHHMPYYTSPTDLTVNWPLVVLYPQHSQLDVIQGASAETMLVMLLAEMFPEPEDNTQSQGMSCVSWDTRGEYHVSNLRVFIQLKTALASQCEEDWLDYLRNKDKNKDQDKETEGEEKKSKEFEADFHMELMEIHLGCTIQQILTAPDLVLTEGILPLIIYPASASDLIRKLFKRFDNRCLLLQPNGVVTQQPGQP